MLTLMSPNDACPLSTYLGIDPGLKTAFALLCRSARSAPSLLIGFMPFEFGPKLNAAMAGTVRGGDTRGHTLKGVAVEAQKIYPGGATKKPESILSLAVKAGALLQAAHTEFGDAAILHPTPSQWQQSSLPKVSGQTKICKALRWQFASNKRHAYPTGFDPNAVPVALLWDEQPTRAEWSDILDAIGIAMWLEHQFRAAKT